MPPPDPPLDLENPPRPLPLPRTPAKGGFPARWLRCPGPGKPWESIDAFVSNPKTSSLPQATLERWKHGAATTSPQLVQVWSPGKFIPKPIQTCGGRSPSTWSDGFGNKFSCAPNVHELGIRLTKGALSKSGWTEMPAQLMSCMQFWRGGLSIPEPGSRGTPRNPPQRGRARRSARCPGPRIHYGSTHSPA